MQFPVLFIDTEPANPDCAKRSAQNACHWGFVKGTHEIMWGRGAIVMIKMGRYNRNPILYEGLFSGLALLSFNSVAAMI